MSMRHSITHTLRHWIALVEAASTAPLYHATTFDAAEAMLKADKLEGRTTQLVDARRGRRRILKRDQWTRQKVYVYDMKGGRLLTGVSLTRDYAFAFGWKNSDVILVLDQAKLAHHFQMIPLDHIRGSRYDYTSPGVGFDKDWMYQAEEFVIGDIAPLSRYLLSVNIPLTVLDRMTLMDHEDRAIMFQHPLLNRLVPRSQRAEYERQPHIRRHGYDPADEEGRGYYADVRPSERWKSDWTLS